MSTRPNIVAFRQVVLRYWKKHGRHDLPWRKTTNPYRILVSEVMLQQTQVPRVIEKYKQFLKKFPTVRTLAEAKLSDVLKIWSGLGYNRRGRYLHDAAKLIMTRHTGKVPSDLISLRALPGMGPYTASAVRVFAFNEPDVLIETNVRAALIHNFYSNVLKNTRIADTELLPVAARAAKGQDPRTWNSALMDYGVYIKKLHQNPTRKSAHYAVQTSFKGSLREVRGAILKTLHEGSHGDLALAQKLSFDGHRVREALAGLERDGLVISKRGSWKIA